LIGIYHFERGAVLNSLYEALVQSYSATLMMANQDCTLPEIPNVFEDFLAFFTRYGEAKEAFKHYQHRNATLLQEATQAAAAQTEKTAQAETRCHTIVKDMTTLRALYSALRDDHKKLQADYDALCKASEVHRQTRTDELKAHGEFIAQTKVVLLQMHEKEANMESIIRGHLSAQADFTTALNYIKDAQKDYFAALKDQEVLSPTPPRSPDPEEPMGSPPSPPQRPKPSNQRALLAALSAKRQKFNTPASH
jgi:hypothetical protein